MKLYELRVGLLGLRSLRDTYYFTSRTDALKSFREHKKQHRVVDLYQCCVNTNLKAGDWCKLLQSDAPGIHCELTPQDLISNRILIATFEKAKAAA